MIKGSGEFTKCRLTISSDTSENTYHKIKYNCSCGNIVLANKYNVKNGKMKSCGCLKKELMIQRNLKHGMRYTDSNLYSTWRGMKQRCTNVNATGYHHYGGRGITVCKEWLDFKNFHTWAIDNGHDRKLSLDRINPDKGYSPDNCRWATRKVQAINKPSYKRSKTVCEKLTKYNFTIQDLLDIKDYCHNLLELVEFNSDETSILYEDARRK